MGELEIWIVKYMSIVDAIISYIPYKRIRTWREFFLSPLTVLSKNIDSVMQRMIDLYIMGAISLILAIVSELLPSVVIGAITMSVDAFFVGIFVALLLFVFILKPIWTFIYSLLEFAVAKLLRGKADFTAHFNASVLPELSVYTVLLPVNIIMIPLSWLSYVPVVNYCASIISLLFSLVGVVAGLYLLYLKYVGFKKVHGFDDLRSAATVIVPVIVTIIVVIVIALIIVATFSGLASLLSSLPKHN